MRQEEHISINKSGMSASINPFSKNPANTFRVHSGRTSRRKVRKWVCGHDAMTIRVIMFD